MIQNLPAKIQKVIEGYTFSVGPQGLSGANVYRLTNNDKALYLKVVSTNNQFAHELEKEYKMMKWLEGKLPAPKALQLEKTVDKYFLLMTAVEGTTLEEVFENNLPRDEIVKMYATALKQIHSVKTDGCPIKINDDTTLEEIKNRIEKGLILDDLQEENKNLTPGELYNKLVSLKPKDYDYVYTHGDYCLDNIMFKNNKFTGVIDIGRSGIGDKYRDIALAIRKLEGLGEEWTKLFLNTYGIENPDWGKIEFYITMDEFF